MKRLLLAGAAVLALGTAAIAQIGTLVGQTPGGAINQNTFNNNTDSVGFALTALNPAVVVPTTSTAQATFTNAGILATGTVITTKQSVITTCSSTTGVTLPAVQRYEAITIQNRSGGSCLIWPSIGATVETALGTDGAVNSPFTMLTNTDITFRPITSTRWLQ